MLTPEGIIALRAVESRLRGLRAQMEDAERRYGGAGSAELRARIDELEADYESLVRAAV